MGFASAGVNALTMLYPSYKSRLRIVARPYSVYDQRLFPTRERIMVRGGTILPLWLALALALPARAQSVADFYRGRTVTISVGLSRAAVATCTSQRGWQSLSKRDSRQLDRVTR